MQLGQIRKEEPWEHLTVIRQRAIREPRKIKWGLSQEGAVLLCI